MDEHGAAAGDAQSSMGGQIELSYVAEWPTCIDGLGYLVDISPPLAKLQVAVSMLVQPTASFCPTEKISTVRNRQVETNLSCFGKTLWFVFYNWCIKWRLRRPGVYLIWFIHKIQLKKCQNGTWPSRAKHVFEVLLAMIGIPVASSQLPWYRCFFSLYFCCDTR